MTEIARKNSGNEREISKIFGFIDSMTGAVRKNTKLLLLIALIVGFIAGSFLQSALTEPKVVTNEIPVLRGHVTFKPFSGSTNHEFICYDSACGIELDARSTNIDNFVGFKSNEIGDNSLAFAGITLQRKYTPNGATITALAEKNGKIIEETFNFKFG